MIKLNVLFVLLHATCSFVQISETSVPPYLMKGAIENVVKAKKQEFYKSSEEVVRSVMNSDIFKDQDRLRYLLQRKETYDENSVCTDAILTAVFDFYLGKQYARQMSDSMGRRESGLLKGNYLWTGTYFECFDATNDKDITGQMCQAIIASQPNATVLAGLTIGICVPDVCTGPQLTAISQSLLGNSTPEGIYVTVICPESENFDVVDITAFVIFGILGTLIILATTYEIIIILKEKQATYKNGKEQIKKDIPAYGKAILSFSVIKNTKALLDTEQKEGNLECLHGLRFISMSWIILGHTVSFTLGLTDNIIDISNYFLSHGSLQAISNSTFSVDTFFFLSGLLVAYLGLREMDKRNGKINVPLMYLSRYLRLTPSMAAVMLFTVSVYSQIGFGLFYQPIMQDSFSKPCQKYWWTNLLYIDNMYPPDLNDMCIGWVWYLANDMQFYILSPIYLLLFYRYPKAGIGAVIFTVVGSAAITGALSNHFNIMSDAVTLASFFRFVIGIGGSDDNPVPVMSSDDSFWNETYVRPWCRIGVYVIGLATGYVIHVTKRKIKMNEVFVTLMWGAVIAVELSVIYGFCGPILYNYTPSNNVMYFYNAVSRPVWALGLSWVTIACVSGYGGPINSFLSWKFFVPLSRLSFCAYLIHPLIVSYIYISREYEMHFAIYLMVYYYLAVLLLSLGLAYLLSMTVEAPMAGILKLIFPKSTKPRAKQHEMNGHVNSEFTDGKITEKNSKIEIENGNVLGKTDSEIDCDRL
ncbi:nose resistant to fluoxetine protein 6-like [Styela clava]